MTTTPSAGAVRAAEKIAEAIFNHSLNSDGEPTNGPEQGELATIIDKETGLADLVEALQVAEKGLVGLVPAPDAWETVRAALAKHQGKG